MASLIEKLGYNKALFGVDDDTYCQPTVVESENIFHLLFYSDYDSYAIKLQELTNK